MNDQHLPGILSASIADVSELLPNVKKKNNNNNPRLQVGLR